MTGPADSLRDDLIEGLRPAWTRFRQPGMGACADGLLPTVRCLLDAARAEGYDRGRNDGEAEASWAALTAARNDISRMLAEQAERWYRRVGQEPPP